MANTLAVGVAGSYFVFNGDMYQCGYYLYKIDNGNITINDRLDHNTSLLFNAAITDIIDGATGNPFADEAAIKTWLSANFFMAAGSGGGSVGASTEAKQDSQINIANTSNNHLDDIESITAQMRDTLVQIQTNTYYTNDNLVKILAAMTTTPLVTSYSSSINPGTIAAGKKMISISNEGQASGSVNGVPLSAGAMVTFPVQLGNTYPAITYDATGTTFKIETIE